MTIISRETNSTANKNDKRPVPHQKPKQHCEMGHKIQTKISKIVVPINNYQKKHQIHQSQQTIKQKKTSSFIPQENPTKNPTKTQQIKQNPNKPPQKKKIEKAATFPTLRARPSPPTAETRSLKSRCLGQHRRGTTKLGRLHLVRTQQCRSSWSWFCFWVFKPY